MRIAILGSRGIPANYSGFETCAEELSTRLVSRGHSVIVYCCSPYSTSDQRFYKGVRRVILPTVRTKSLEKIIYAAISLLHVSFTRTDVVLMLGLNIPILCWIPRMAGIKVATNVDGLEWKRKKWGAIASKYLLLAERMAGWASDRLITDARYVQDYYMNKYGKPTTYIAYGADVSHYPPGDTLRRYNLEKDGYILYVARFDPEYNALLVREAYEMLRKPGKKLVMVGDSPFSREYVKQVRDTDNDDIIFTGFLYGAGYRELASNACFYIQASEVGGTHPALVEAMGFGNLVLANDVPEHREVLEDAGMFYKGKDDLAGKMELLLNHPDMAITLKSKAHEIIRKKYSWDDITAAYEKLFTEMMAG